MKKTICFLFFSVSCLNTYAFEIYDIGKCESRTVSYADGSSTLVYDLYYQSLGCPEYLCSSGPKRTYHKYEFSELDECEKVRAKMMTELVKDR